MKCNNTLSPGPLQSLWWCYLLCFCSLTRPWHAAVNLVLCLFYVFIAPCRMVSARCASSGTESEHRAPSYWLRRWRGCAVVPLSQLLVHPLHLRSLVKTKEQSFCWWANDECDVMGREILLLCNVKCKAPALHSPPHLGTLNSPTACTLPWQLG